MPQRLLARSRESSAAELQHAADGGNHLRRRGGGHFCTTRCDCRQVQPNTIALWYDFLVFHVCFFRGRRYLTPPVAISDYWVVTRLSKQPCLAALRIECSWQGPGGGFSLRGDQTVYLEGVPIAFRYKVCFSRTVAFAAFLPGSGDRGSCLNFACRQLQIKLSHPNDRVNQLTIRNLLVWIEGAARVIAALREFPTVSDSYCRFSWAFPSLSRLSMCFLISELLIASNTSE